MLNRSVTCYELQRNTASIINIQFHYVFVYVRKVNLSAIKTALICCISQKVFIKGRQYAVTEKAVLNSQFRVRTRVHFLRTRIRTWTRASGTRTRTRTLENC